MRSRAAAARLPSSSTNSCKSDTSRHNSLGWELRCRRRRRRRRRAAAWEYAPYLCVTVKTKNNLRKDASLCSVRPWRRRHCWSTLAITHGKFGLLCGILQPWHAPSHLNEIIAQLPCALYRQIFVRSSSFCRTWREHVRCVQKLFWMSEISVRIMFSPDLSLEFSCIELVIQWTISRHIVG